MFVRGWGLELRTLNMLRRHYTNGAALLGQELAFMIGSPRLRSAMPHTQNPYVNKVHASPAPFDNEL